jgi:serine/threonine protein kinase
MAGEGLPEKFGRYEVIGELGRGSMGMVYKARDPVIGRLVAIKAIPETFGLEAGKREEYIKRLQREAITAGRLQHPNIVTIYDVGESRVGPYIAMEFLDGITLREVIVSGKRLSLAQLVEFIRQVADGLDYAHSKAVIHRDIKPANLMLVENLVKIMDLGIARLPVSDLTREGKLVGSPSYMSPEQLQSQPLDGRSDLFSLAVVMYQAVTGYKPFPGEDIHEICYKIVNSEFEHPSRLNPAVPKAFDRLMEKALAKKPEDRFQTGQELFQALREIMQGKEVPEDESLEKTTVVAEAPPGETGELETTSNPNLTVSSDIEDIFRDLTSGHRTIRLDKRVSGSRIMFWIIWLALILGSATAILWIIFGR